MEIWLNWLVGLLIWIVCIIILSIITFLIMISSNKSVKGKIPDEAFDYHYRPDFIPKDAYLFDSHSHTLASDGSMTPEQNIKWHIANGYDAFVVTDHNTSANNKPSTDLQEKYPNILIIPGFEHTSPLIHLNFIGIEDYPEKVPLIPSIKDVKKAIQIVKDLGGVVQCDHISWTVDRIGHRNGQYVHPTRDELIEWGVDGFEINNEMRWYDPRTIHHLENLKAAGKLPRPIFMSTGTDVHNPVKEWATCWTELLLTPEEKKNPTIDIVKKALLEGRTKIWVDHDYRHPPEAEFCQIIETSTTKKALLAPFISLGNGITENPAGVLKSVLSHVFWFVLAYFFFRIFFTLIGTI